MAMEIIQDHSHNWEKDFSILAVDDFALNRKVLDLQLNEHPFKKVTIVENGNDLLDEYKTHQYHAIILDLGMPSPDGYECAKLIRAYEIKRGKGERIPIFAYTAFTIDNDDEVFKCYYAGIDELIQKPDVEKKLYETIKKYLHNNDNLKRGTKGARRVK